MMNKIMKTAVSMVLMIAVTICSFAMSVSAGDSTEGTTPQWKSFLSLAEYRDNYTTLYSHLPAPTSHYFGKGLTATEIHEMEAIAIYGEHKEACKKFCTDRYVGYDYYMDISSYSEISGLEHFRYFLKSEPVYDVANNQIKLCGKDELVYSSKYANGKPSLTGVSSAGFSLNTLDHRYVYVYFGGNVVIRDTDGNEVDLGGYGVETGNIFDKPYYSLTDYNALMDIMGDTYASKKLSTKGQLLGASKLNDTLIKGDFGAKTDIDATSFALNSFCNSHKVKVYNTGFWAIDKNLKAYYYQVISDTPIRFEINDKNSLVSKHGATIYFNEKNASCNLVAVMKPNGRYNNVVLVDHSTKKVENYEVFKDWESGQKVLQTGMTFVIDDGTTTSDRLPGQETGDGVIDDGAGGETTVGGGDTTTNMPTKPGEGSTILDWISYIFESIVTLIDNLIRGVTDVTASCGNFFQFLGKAFSFVPSEIWVIVTIGIGITVLLRLLGR